MSLIYKGNHCPSLQKNSYEETSPENCSVDHEADLKHSREVCMKPIFCQFGNNVSAYEHK
ncbi:unnamed protein product, partial [Prunus brigantina]